MTTSKPFLILQLRPENDTSDSEFEAILKYGGLDEKDVCRMRIETTGIPDLSLDDYSAIIVGGSPFDISTPEDEKSAIQKKIETDFKHLLDQIVSNDFPFLGACSGSGLLGSYLKTPISSQYAEPVGSAPTPRYWLKCASNSKEDRPDGSSLMLIRWSKSPPNCKEVKGISR
jgi:GMP synthase (glutamine-hydrolysing)